MKIKIITIILLLSVLTGCRGNQINQPTKQPPTTAQVAENIPDDSKVTEEKIRFLEDRVKLDHDDMISYNLLGRLYLQKLRETGDVNYLVLANKVARASLDVLPELYNTEGLRLLAEAEYSSHNFQSAREHGTKLMELDPNKVYPYQIIGDSLLELGEYSKAESLFRKMAKLSENSNIGNASIEIRLSRLEFLQGNIDKSDNHLNTALKYALSSKPLQRETIAWLHWQLGENAFAAGNYQQAEEHYKNSLIIFPNYYRAVASMGRVKAALGDLTGAIAHFQNAIQLIPDPTFVAMLGDLYKLNNQEKEAQQQYKLVEQIGRLSELNGVLYNRNLALFYADHDLKPAEAFDNAQKEYQERRDIYGADAVAWTALKAGKLSEAQTAIKEALKLGTKDARIYFHAGMIALEAGDKNSARDYLLKAQKLNPKFDPLQSLACQNALSKLAS